MEDIYFIILAGLPFLVILYITGVIIGTTNKNKSKFLIDYTRKKGYELLNKNTQKRLNKKKIFFLYASKSILPSF